MVKESPAEDLIKTAKIALILGALEKQPPGKAIKITAEQEPEGLLDRLISEDLYEGEIQGNFGICFIGANDDEKKGWEERLDWRSTDHLRISYDISDSIGWRNKKEVGETGFDPFGSGEQVPVILGVYLDAEAEVKSASLLQFSADYGPERVLGVMLDIKGEGHEESPGYKAAKNILKCWPADEDLGLSQWGEFLCAVFPEEGGGAPTSDRVYENMWCLGLLMDKEVKEWDRADEKKIKGHIRSNLALLRKIIFWSARVRSAVERWWRESFYLGSPEKQPYLLEAIELEKLEKKPPRGKVRGHLRSIGKVDIREEAIELLKSRSPVDLSKQLVDAILKAPAKPSTKEYDAEQLFTLFPYSHAANLLSEDSYKSPGCVFDSVWAKVKGELSSKVLGQLDEAGQDGKVPDLDKIKDQGEKLQGQVSWAGQEAVFKWRLGYNQRYLFLLRLWASEGRTLSGLIGGEARLATIEELASDSMKPKRWREFFREIGFIKAGEDKWSDNELQDVDAGPDEKYFHILAKHIYDALILREEIYRHEGLFECLLVAPVIACYEGAPFSDLLRRYYKELESAFLLAKKEEEYFKKTHRGLFTELKTCLRDIEVYRTGDHEPGSKQGYMILGPLNPLKLWTYIEFNKEYQEYLEGLEIALLQVEGGDGEGEVDVANDDENIEEENEGAEVADPSKLRILPGLRGHDLSRFRDFLGESVLRLVPPYKTLACQRDDGWYVYDGSVPDCRGGAIFSQKPTTLIQANEVFWKSVFERIRKTVPALSQGLKVSVYADSNPGQMLKALLKQARMLGGFKRVDLTIYTSSEDLNLKHGLQGEDLNSVFGHEGPHRQLSCHTTSSVEDWVESVKRDTPHLAIFLSLSPPEGTAHARLDSMDLHPCVVPVVYQFNPMREGSSEGGEMVALPATEDSAGFMTAFMDVHNSLAGIDKDEAIKVMVGSELGLEHLETVLANSAWSVFVRPAGARWKPKGSAILWSSEMGRGEVEFQVLAGWTRPIDLLLQSVDCPAKEILTLATVSRYTEGVSSLLGENLDTLQNKLKGTLGAVLTAEAIESYGLLTDYRADEVTVVFSVDRKDHMKWIGLLGPQEQRCDLASFSVVDGELVVHAIEVKYTQDCPWRTDGRQARRKAVEQALATQRSLQGLFLAEDFAALPRLEVLHSLLARRLLADLSEKKRVDQQLEIKRFLEIVGETLHSTSKRRNCRVVPVVCWVNDAAEKFDITGVDFIPPQGTDYPELPGKIIEIPGSGKWEEAAVEEEESAVEEEESAVEEEAAVEEEESAVEEEESAVEEEPAVEEEESAVEEEPAVEEEEEKPVEGGEAAPVDLEDKLRIDPGTLDEIARKLKTVLNNHKVLFKDLSPEGFGIGPRLIRCRFTLQPGEKADRAVKAAKDIGRELSLATDPVIARELGTDCLYLDYPRDDGLVTIHHEDLMGLFHSEVGAPPLAPTNLSFILGLTPSGEFKVGNLKKLPHLAIGGTTGSGKSVFLRGLFYDLISTHTADSLELYIVDPKEVDFTLMEGLPCVRNVFTEADDILQLLTRIETEELVARKALINEARVQDVEQLLEKTGDSPPAIVIAIDEFRDLMDTFESDRAKKAAFELGIRKIAQKGRAYGIHLILATQRPDAEAIPGSILNNIDGRACLRVVDHRASNMIINNSQGQYLMGLGDMFFRSPGEEIVRVQVPYIEVADLESLRPVP